MFDSRARRQASLVRGVCRQSPRSGPQTWGADPRRCGSGRGWRNAEVGEAGWDEPDAWSEAERGAGPARRVGRAEWWSRGPDGGLGAEARGSGAAVWQAGWSYDMR